MGTVSTLILIILLVLIVLVFWPKISELLNLGVSLVSNPQPKFNFTFPNNITNSSQANQNISYAPLINYTLGLINKDRAAYGLPPVTQSPELSAQQHADSMLKYNYFSHWDIYGMKPYMRYTILDGRGAVQENIAYTRSGVSSCLGNICRSYGNVNVSTAIKDLEYSMVYNDSICCNNGHRYNILDPNHNQVSIGVAYNSTNVYLVEDFINNYVTWLNNTPNFDNGEVTLVGITSQYPLSSIEITYDPPVTNMSTQELNHTAEYGYGSSIAGVVSSRSDYYPNLTTIVADTYYTRGSDFDISFNMSKLDHSYGAGEYTLLLWMNNSTSSFIGSSYTIFLNPNGTEYAPSNI